ncbi:OTU-domain-containing protein [Cutaneotrichosporon oleaginosum]|uniref:Ubiquitin thioesterase OTU n=1 Tax=Cutaneotrichosporon oleaginosum TaxID=879819 RepID=A0A0J0XQ78_9TREE|nr:OTU-domain-containing protein [Cutaneotrichosporon oleaginosum]KLT43253.1 OTU-domain-containing protein [Cutaneotrichosporon oleaginosum]
MIPVRLRHPRGVTTIEVDPETQGVRDLKVLIFSSTEIPPSEQEIKFGYPPKPLPDTAGRLASIPITRGEQLIVTAVRARSPKRARRPSVKELDAELSAPRPPAPAVDTARDMPLETSESVTLPGDAGYLQLRIVPDDNSCLFSAVAVVFEGGIEAAQKLRRVVADAIRDDPTTYSDVIQPRETYISKILEPNTWGGAVELAIFAQHYQTEIASFDVATGRCDRFGEDQHDQRCLLVYSGIHYDAMTLSPMPAAPPSFHTTVFPLSDAAVMDAARTLVQRLKAKKYYTDTANFDLRCGVCGIGLKGEKGAREHAMATGHVEFGEY